MLTKKLFRYTKSFFPILVTSERFQFLPFRIFSRNVENLISNKISHEKFKSDKNYRFFMVEIERKFFI